MTLFNKILVKNLESSKSYRKELEETVKCSGSTITKYKDKPSEAESFQLMLDIIRFMDADREIEIIADYAKYVNPNRQSARHVLEYLLCNRLLEDMDELLTRMENENTNKQNKEYIKVYRILYNRNANLMTPDEQLAGLKSVNEKDSVLSILTKIVQCYAYYDKDHYKILLETVSGLEDEINGIKEEYVKRAFKAKYHEIMSFLNLWVMNDYDKALEHAAHVMELNIGETYTAYANVIAGYSTFFTSYNDTKKHLEASRNLYGMIGRIEGVDFAIEALEMLDVHYKLKKGNTFVSKRNELYYKAVNGLPIDDLEDNKETLEEGFYLLIKGLSEDDTDLLMGSMIEYLGEGNGFYSSFAKNELLKRGFSNYVLEKLHKINVA